MGQVKDLKTKKTHTHTHLHTYIHIYHKKMEIIATYDIGNSDVRCS